VVFPAGLDCPEFSEAWGQWRDHLTQKKVKRTPIAAQMQLKKLGEMGRDRAIAAIHNSIAGNYQGIFEPSTPNGSRKQTPAPTSQWASAF
jgi:hypothetical protein